MLDTKTLSIILTMLVAWANHRQYNLACDFPVSHAGIISCNSGIAVGSGSVAESVWGFLWEVQLVHLEYHRLVHPHIPPWHSPLASAVCVAVVPAFVQRMCGLMLDACSLLEPNKTNTIIIRITFTCMLTNNS